MPPSPFRFLAVSMALHGVAFAAVAVALPSAQTAPREVSVGVRWTSPATLEVADPYALTQPFCGVDPPLVPAPIEQELEFDVPAVEFVDAAVTPEPEGGSDDGGRPPFGVDARLGAGPDTPLGTSGGRGPGEATGSGPESGESASRDLSSADGPPAAAPSAPPAPSAPARILETIAPAYPEPARVAGDEGVVVLEGEVLADGCVGEVTVVRSSGSSVLDRAALAAVRRWRFAAALEEGVAVRSVLRLPPIRFRLD